MKKSLLILFAMLVPAACRSSPLPAPTASPSVAASPAATENPPTSTSVGEVPYPLPSSTIRTANPGYPFMPPTQTYTPAPVVTETPVRVDLSGVRLAKLLNDQQGWILSDGELLWTDDAGQHWRQITPAEIGEGFIHNAFFFDPLQAWALVCHPQPSGGVIEIMYTSNGGDTWGMSEVTSMKEIMTPPRQECGEVQTFFLNAQEGWILVDTTQTMNSHHGEMFQTLDGGQTWHHLDTSPLGEFFFVSGKTGWMSATCCTGGPWQLYRTEDGGTTWEGVGVNGSDDQDDLYLPFFFDQESGILFVILRDPGMPNNEVTFFKTQDGGHSWESAGKLSVPLNSGDLDIGLGSLNDIQIWDEQTWVLTLPNYGVFWTLDGGQNWVENTTGIGRLIFQLTLGSATSGWGLKCDQGSVPRCLYLVATADMGAHWESVPVNP